MPVDSGVNYSRYGKTPKKTYSDIRTMLPDTRQQEIARLREANPYPTDEYTSQEVEVEPGPSDGSEPTTSSGEFYDAVFGQGEPTAKPEPEAEKPKPEKPKPKPIKTHPTPSKMISSAGWIADLMTQMGFAPEEAAETNTSRYPRQEAVVPELGLRGQSDDQWMGLLSALLEEKKRKEARSMA